MFPKIDPAAIARSPKTRRWGIRFAIFVAVIGVLGFLVVPPVLKSILLGKLGEALHREVSIASISLNPYTLTAQVEGFSIREKDGKELVGFDSLLVNLELSSIAHRGVVIKEVSLVGPRARLVRLDANRYNISDLIDEFAANPKADTPEPPDAPPPRFSVNNIQISGGRIEFEDLPEKASHVVSDIALRLPFVSSLSYYTEVYVEPHFSANVNGAPLVLNGKSKPFDDSRESELALDLDNLQLAKYLTYSPVELPIRMPSGALDGDLHLRFVETRGQPSTLTLDGKLALKDLRLEEANGAPLLAMKQLEVVLKDADLVHRRIGIERVAFDAPEIDVRIGKQGELNWLALLPKEKGGAKAATPASPAAVSAPDAAPAKASGSQPPLALTLETLAIKDGAVRLLDVSGGSEQKQSVEKIDIEVHRSHLDLAKQTVEIGEVVSKGLRVQAMRPPAGRTGAKASTPAAASPASTSSSARAPAAKPAPKASPWTVNLAKLKLADYQLRFEDRQFKPVAVQLLEIASLDIENLSTRPDAEAKLDAALKLNQKGFVKLAGTVSPQVPSGEIAIDAQELELLPLQPYFGEKLNVVVTRGQVTTKGTVQFKPGNDGISAGFKGQLTVGNFHSIDKANSTDLLKWKSFYFGNIDVRSSPLSVGVGEIALSDFYARIILGKDGKLNLAQLVKKSEAEEAEAAAAAAAKAAPAEKGDAAPASAPVPAPVAQAAPADAPKEVVPIKIGKVTLQGGNINFSDYFVKPNYSANLKKIGGRISSLSSVEGTVADLELRGSYNDLAPINITAKLNPLAAKRYLDLEAEVRGVEMTGFSTYAGKYAGYGIEKGQLSLFLKYKIDDRQLTAENRVFLDQLTFGDEVESTEATKLPVKLAVSLLQNRKGEIDINLPISGSLDDPQFSVGGVIVKVILNIFVKAVTSPVALLGSLFGGGDEMAFIEFDYGYATLSDQMRERMKTLAKVLEERPSMKLEIAGRVDPERDREGLKKALVERRVKAQKQADLVKKGTESGSVDDIAIDAKEYPALLERAYRAEKFPKPRNFIGLVKELPVDEMEKLMMANIKGSDEELRDLAERRAAAVREWMVSQGKVAAERVFTVQPHMSPKEGPQAEKAKDSRVDFLLK